MADHIIKNVYTEYYSGAVVPTPIPGNIEFCAGSAQRGLLETVYQISDKATAKALFGGGELLKAIEEKIDASEGAAVLYALRIASSSVAGASVNVMDATTIAIPAIVLTAKEKGTWFNSDRVTIDVAADQSNRTITITFGDSIFSYTGTTNAALISAINADTNCPVSASLATGAPTVVKAQSSLHLSGGNDGEVLANGDYTAAITLSENYTDSSWVHFIGASTVALWTAILTSCADMVSSNRGERFAFLDFPRMTAVNPLLPTLTEVATYLTACKALYDSVRDRNAVFCAGEGKFISSDGTIYTNRLTNSISGLLAKLDVQESLLGEKPVNLINLTTQFNVAQQTTLVVDCVNHFYFQSGYGNIIKLSQTRCPVGDAFNRIEKLRAVYMAGKRCRAAAFPHLGQPNDSQGHGVKLLETDMKRPLQMMLDANQIDSFDLSIECTAEMRNVGEAKVILTIESMKVFEIILNQIYLQ